MCLCIGLAVKDTTLSASAMSQAVSYFATHDNESLSKGNIMNNEVQSYLNAIKENKFFLDETNEGSLRFNIKWYRERASVSHKWFRIVGFTTVFLSITLPFVSQVFPNKAEPTVYMSWLIALAGGANGFFQWGRTWQSRTEAYLRLERLYMEWEILTHGPNISIKDVTLATKTLVFEARETIKTETGAFFEEVQFPEIKAPGNTPK